MSFKHESCHKDVVRPEAPAQFRISKSTRGVKIFKAESSRKMLKTCCCPRKILIKYGCSRKIPVKCGYPRKILFKCGCPRKILVKHGFPRKILVKCGCPRKGLDLSCLFPGWPVAIPPFLPPANHPSFQGLLP